MRKYALLTLALIAGVAMAVTTPLMNLDLPDPGVTSGPQWAQKLNTAFNVIDSHNHTSGQGARVPVAGLNINADLGLGGYNLSSANSARFVNQGSPLAGASDVNSVYVSGGELYYNDASGAQVKLTDAGSINVASLGTIGGDYGGSDPASVFYTNSTKTYSFTQSSGVVGKMAFGDFTVYETVGGANGITVKSPTSLASSYTLTLLPSLPASNRLVAVSATGDLTAGATNAVQTSDITDSAVTTAKIQDGAVTQAKRASLGQQTSSSSGSFSTSSASVVDVTNLSVSITTTGRPVMAVLQAPGNTSSANGITASASASFVRCQIILDRGGTDVASGNISSQASGASAVSNSEPSVTFMDYGVTAGTYTYKIQTQLTSGSGQCDFRDMTLTVFEL